MSKTLFSDGVPASAYGGLQPQSAVEQIESYLAELREYMKFKVQQRSEHDRIRSKTAIKRRTTR